ncbi:MAG TPA: basic secretory protein-like protein [Tepidisphaeraceae bacterium]|nr:basic secretory protein-like protein [Tepidisphaeraceae bacterium]
MRLWQSFLVATFPVWMLCVPLRGDAQVTAERVANDRASAAFHFAKVPPPAVDDAAARATFTILEGRRDSNGGGLDQLNDGDVPQSSDEPQSNFFFSQRTDKGRLRIDLGRVIDVKQVNTYSWHTDVRAPQVYKLYAADGTAPKFEPAPANDVDPTTVGWKLLASVDTRPAEGPPGGQYGVSISDTAGSVGKYRYLLLETSRTETADAFGNTFYSEIDVIDANAPPPTTRPVVADRHYQILIDTSETPELKDWAETKLRPVLEKWYPIIVAMFPDDGFTAPRKLDVKFIANMPGVANTAGTHVRCAAGWFTKNLRGEATGAAVHELVHVVQQYHSGRNPGWLVEGVADYVRWFKYEPASRRPRPDPNRAKYTDSYRTTAAFLNYVTETHDKDIVKELNTAMRQGKYDDALWKSRTGKTVAELWDEYVATLRK